VIDCLTLMTLVYDTRALGQAVAWRRKKRIHQSEVCAFYRLGCRWHPSSPLPPHLAGVRLKVKGVPCRTTTNSTALPSFTAMTFMQETPQQPSG
jgi:hypothetical protein